MNNADSGRETGIVYQLRVEKSGEDVRQNMEKFVTATYYRNQVRKYSYADDMTVKAAISTKPNQVTVYLQRQIKETEK